MSDILNCEVPYKTSATFTIKKMDEEKGKPLKLKGYASVFGNKDLYGDVIMPKAFDKSIKDTKGKWPLFLNHDSTAQVGMNIKAEEDTKGLLTEAVIYNDDSAIPKAQEAVALIRNAMKWGVPMGLSIGGIVEKVKVIYDPDAKEGEKYTLEIHEFKMLEHSITSIPANEKARVTDLKSILNKEFLRGSVSNKNYFVDFAEKFINYCN